MEVPGIVVGAMVQPLFENVHFFVANTGKPEPAARVPDRISEPKEPLEAVVATLPDMPAVPLARSTGPVICVPVTMLFSSIYLLLIIVEVIEVIVIDMPL